MCNNCKIVKSTFEGAKSNPHENLYPVYNLLSALVRTGRLIIYAGDCPFENMLQTLQEEKHFTVCFYLQCPQCEEIYFFGACIRGTPIYKRIVNISKENISNLIWGSEGTYFM